MALLYCLHLAVELKGCAEVKRSLSSGLCILIAGDNDFYSQREGDQAMSAEALAALDPFKSHPCKLGDAHKTGLGSSAAMTTSLVASLLVHLGVVPSRDANTKLSTWSLGLIHNVAQLVHCAAQGKVGSGFDVSSAVWGSQLYRRFDPNVLQELIRDESSRLGTAEGSAAQVCTAILASTADRQEASPLVLHAHLDPYHPLWRPSPKSTSADALPTAAEGASELAREQHPDDDDTRVYRPAPLRLPPGIHLLLADVDAGSNTRTLVGTVSAWRKEKPEWAAQLYRVIGAANQSLCDGLLTLHVEHEKDPALYGQVLADLAAQRSAAWDTYKKEKPSSVVDAFIEVRNTLRSIRAGMRELGVRSQAPVEPPEMERLLSATINGADGILGGGVPGAGGYDALYFLRLQPLGTPSVAVPPQVGELWRTWSELSVGPLLCGADHPADEVAPAGQSSSDTPVERVIHTLAFSRPGLRVEQPSSVPGLQRILEAP